MFFFQFLDLAFETSDLALKEIDRVLFGLEFYFQALDLAFETLDFALFGLEFFIQALDLAFETSDLALKGIDRVLFGLAIRKEKLRCFNGRFLIGISAVLRILYF